MRSVNIVVFILFFIFLFSCGQKKENKLGLNLIKDVRFDYPPQEVFGEEKYFDLIIDPARIEIGDGLLYISCFKCDTVFYTFKLPELVLLNSFGCKGAGPEDFIFPVFCEASGDTVSLWGYSSLRKVVQFKVDKTGQWNIVRDYRLDEEKPYNQLRLINDSVFYYNNYPPDLEIRRINGNNSKENIVYKFVMDQDATNAFFMNNKGDIVASNQGVAYLYYYKNRIDFFNLDLELVKTINTGISKESIDKNNEKNSIIYHVSHYGGRNLYTINIQNSKANFKREYSNLQVFTWNGEPVNSYKIYPAVDVFVVDEINNIIYGYNYDKPNSLFVYDISKTS